MEKEVKNSTGNDFKQQIQLYTNKLKCDYQSLINQNKLNAKSQDEIIKAYFAQISTVYDVWKKTNKGIFDYESALKTNMLTFGLDIGPNIPKLEVIVAPLIDHKYIPKNVDIAKITNDDIKLVFDNLNTNYLAFLIFLLEPSIINIFNSINTINNIVKYNLVDMITKNSKLLDEIKKISFYYKQNISLNVTPNKCFKI